MSKRNNNNKLTNREIKEMFDTMEPVFEYNDWHCPKCNSLNTIIDAFREEPIIICFDCKKIYPYDKIHYFEIKGNIKDE